MSVHTEWDVATECDIEVLTAEAAENALRPAAAIDHGSHVLVLGGAGGGCLALEGDLAQLAEFSDRVAQALTAAQATAPVTTSARRIPPRPRSGDVHRSGL